MSEGPWKLPEGWRWIRVGDLSLPTKQRDPTTEPEETFVYVDISAIDSSTESIVAPRSLLGKEAPSRARKIIRKDDVIFATTRPNLKNIALVPPELDDQVCSTGFAVLRADPALVSPKWLLYISRSDVVLGQLAEKIRGASYPAITDRDILSSPIPLPPIEEQQRIVAKIESLFSRIREAKALRERAEKETGNLVESAMTDAFADSKSWPRHRLQEVVAIAVGLVDPRLPEYQDLPHISGSSIEIATGRLLPYRTAAEDEVISSNYLFAPGDILYQKIRPYLRKVALVQFSGVCSADIYPVRITANDLLMPGFLRWALVSPEFTAYAINVSKRARMPKINRDQFLSYEMAIPPMSQQEDIVSVLDASESYSHEIIDIQEETSAELDRLEQSILDRAFRGEL